MEIVVAGEFPGFQCGERRSAFLNLGLDVEMDRVNYHLISSFGIYCRLSRDDERIGESVSIENQKEMLGRYVREQGWNLYATYCDDGYMGKI